MNRQERRRNARRNRGRGADPDALFDKAAKNLRDGRSDYAERLFRRVVELKPDNAEALHLLGLAAYQGGRPEEAADLFKEAIAVDDGNPVYHSNLGVVCNLLARPADAEAALNRAVELQPEYAEAHNNLGVALKMQGRLKEAAEACRMAIDLMPGYAEAFVNLGNVRRHQGRPGDAVEVYRQAIALEPRQFMAHAYLGAALRELGDTEGAVESCRHAVELRPDRAEPHNNLGTALMAADDRAGAEAAFSNAIRLDAAHGHARINLAALLYADGRVEEAETVYREALADDPALAEAENGLGVVLQATGRLDAAGAAYRRAVAIRPDYVEAWYNLAAARDLDDGEVDALETLLTAEDRPAPARLKLHFALGESYDARGEAETAFGHFARGNALRREDLARLGRSFDDAAHERFIDAVAGLFDGDFFAARRGFGDASTLPVFVVGMPRSGTTLVEQILASHQDVFGAGELDALGGFVPRFPEGVKELDAEAAADLAGSHLKRLTGLGVAALRVVDKTPLNFLYLGLISLLFPAARIIHCRRDARDVCLSCFAQNFVAGHGWSTDLADLAAYFRQYRRLMAHWHDVLPLPVLDVDYEALVADSEAESRRLVDFLDLPWDGACLEFHEARHVVRSASNWQVRRPVHTGSIGRWRAYERWLGPIL